MSYLPSYGVVTVFIDCDETSVNKWDQKGWGLCYKKTV